MGAVKGVQLAILSDAAVQEEGLAEQGPAAEYPRAENLKFALVHVCGRQLPSDEQIDSGWQATWGAYASDAPRVYSASELAMHYRGSAATAIAELKRVATCHTYDANGLTYTIVAPPSIPPVAGAGAQFDYCENFGGPTTDCTVVLTHGHVAAALRVQGLTAAGARRGAANLAGPLAQAVARADMTR
ncbi:MAG: hypothetical protein ACR2LX_06280 [Jatrophihabitans sp.]